MSTRQGRRRLVDDAPAPREDRGPANRARRFRPARPRSADAVWPVVLAIDPRHPEGVAADALAIPRPALPTTRRSILAAAVAGLGLAASSRPRRRGRRRRGGADAPIAPRDPLKITRLETFLVKPRWLFLKVHTDAGIVGLGEPVVEGRAETVADGGQGDRAVPGRQGPAAGRPPLAGDLPPRLLPRRPGPHQRPQRHRHGPVGHQGQGPRRAGLRAARRPDPRPGPRLRPRPHARARCKEQLAAGLHRLQDRARVQARDPPATSRRRPRSSYAAEQFAALRKAAGDDVGHRHRLPRRDQPGHGQAADQGAGAATSRCSSRSRASARTTT